MPTIPDNRAITRRGISGSLPGVRAPEWVDPTPGLADALEGQAKRQLLKEAADAETSFYLAKTGIEGKLDEDTDWQTMPDRYDEEVSTALGEAVSGISNARVRDEFLNRAMLDVAAGKERVQNLAFAREGEQRRGELLEIGDSLRQTALRSGRPQDAITQYSKQVDTMVEAGYIRADAGSKLLQKYKEDTAIGYIETLPYGAQVSALRQPAAIDNIPEDVRRVMLRRAAENHRIESERIASQERERISTEFARDALETSGGSIDSAYHLARNDERLRKDPKLYNEVMSQIGVEYNRFQASRNERRDGLMKALYDPFASGERKRSDLTDEEWRTLNREDHRMLAALENAPPAAKRDNFQAEDDLQFLFSSENWGELRSAFVEYWEDGRLSDAQIKHWMPLSYTGIRPETAEADNLLDPMQTLTAALDENSITDKAMRGKAKRMLTKWHRDQQEKYGKTPDPDKVEQYIGTLLSDAATPGRVFDKRPIDYEPKDKLNLARKYKRDDPEKFMALGRQIGGDWVSVDPAEMMRLWVSMPPSPERKMRDIAENEPEIYSDAMQLAEDEGWINPSADELLRFVEIVRGER